MNKAELIAAIAEDASLSKADAKRALDSFVNNIVDTVSSGQSVALIGFGTFGIKERSARTGRNPSTGAQINIPAKRVPVFKAGSQFKEAVE